MIKRRKRSKALSLFICMMTAILFISYVGMNAEATGNITDTPFYFSGTSMYTMTDPRDKWDYTSSYVYSNSSSTRSITEVRVFGCVLYSGTVVSSVDCTFGDPVEVQPGEYKYLPNLVKESGYNYARLQLYVDSSAYKYIFGVWSPDSV